MCHTSTVLRWEQLRRDKQWRDSTPPDRHLKQNGAKLWKTSASVNVSQFGSGDSSWSVLRLLMLWKSLSCFLERVLKIGAVFPLFSNRSMQLHLQGSCECVRLGHRDAKEVREMTRALDVARARCSHRQLISLSLCRVRSSLHTVKFTDETIL